MANLAKLIDRIVDRVNINLREPSFDVGPYVKGLIEPHKFSRFYAFYGLTKEHGLHFYFKNSSLAGSYFLDKVVVEDSVVYKSDVRGDELKQRGDKFEYRGLAIPLHDDEVIHIKDSFLVKTLVHNYSHDPESPEEFFIKNSVSMPYANIHGSPTEGSFLGPFATLDLTTAHDSVIGTFAYVQTGELSHATIEPGRVWVQYPEFDFSYRFAGKVLERYIRLEPGRQPEGIFMDFVEEKKRDFEEVFRLVRGKPSIMVPKGASLSSYSVVCGNSRLAENVLVAQRAYLKNAVLGKGANTQENCYIVDSELTGLDVTAHGGKVINARIGEKVFVGFNSFLRGSADCRLEIGDGCIVMPHTIIDLAEPLSVPPGMLLWGFIAGGKDLASHSLPLAKLAKTSGGIKIGKMVFKGSGKSFVDAFTRRIEHILEVNGAYYRSGQDKGHAQRSKVISFNTIEPYPSGPQKGIYPTIDIRP